MLPFQKLILPPSPQMDRKMITDMICKHIHLLFFGWKYECYYLEVIQHTAFFRIYEVEPALEA
jgi:hypothetical protein